MLYKKTAGFTGSWVKAAELIAMNVKKAKIVSETEPQKSQFKNKDGSDKWQDVAKVKFQGIEEPVNVSFNRATLNALVDAFGEDSKEWIGKVLGVETEEVRVAGKKVTALYLVPEDYKRIDDENGYALIVKEGGEEASMDTVNLDDEF